MLDDAPLYSLAWHGQQSVDKVAKGLKLFRRTGHMVSMITPK